MVLGPQVIAPPTTTTTVPPTTVPPTTTTTVDEVVLGPQVIAPPTTAAPSSRLLTGVHASSSGQSASVARLYMAVFTRQPDRSGHDFWVGRANSGVDMMTIASDFVASREFVSTYAQLDNAAFVRLLYRNVMDRDGDRIGIAYWTGRLDGGTNRAFVTLLFSESSEFRTLTGTN